MNKSQKQSKPPRLMMGNSNLEFCKQIFLADGKLFIFLKGIHRLIVWTITGNHDSILALPHWKNRSENLQSPVPVFCLTHHFEWIVFGTNNNVSIGNYLGQCFLESVFRPPYVWKLLWHRFWAVWNDVLQWNSQQVFFGGSLIVHQKFTCRTICPRRECRGRSHPHPLHRPILRKA